MAKNKKRKNNTKNKKVIKKENNIKEKGIFDAFISKKWVEIIIHIISGIIWVAFLADFFTFKNIQGYPNPLLSILTLVTLFLEWRVYKIRHM